MSSGKVVVEGARRIWGTLKNFPSTAVLGAISKLTEVKDSLQIRRKFKKLTGNKMLWWFVIHCEEEILCKLDAEWEKVKFQTGWTLQKCYKPANEEEQPGTDRNTQMQSATLPESQYNLEHQANGSSTTMLDAETSIVIPIPLMMVIWSNQQKLFLLLTQSTRKATLLILF